MIKQMEKIVEQGFCVLLRYGDSGSSPGWFAHIYKSDESHPLKYPDPNRSYQRLSTVGPEDAWAGALEKFNGAEHD